MTERRKKLHTRGTIKRVVGKIIQFLEHKIIIKMDCHKLKFFIDIGFITSEKIFSKLNKLLPTYIHYYQELIQTEIELAQLTKAYKILDIGSGSIPASCILLAKGTTAAVTGIDKDLESVKRSKKIISRLNLEGRVEIIYANAMEFPMNDFDIIIIANGIQPYNDLLERVAKNMRDDATVVFRTFSHHYEELAPKDYFLKKIFRVGRKTFHKKSGSLVSILLYKK
jgi:precorrin-6B methylase 2